MGEGFEVIAASTVKTHQQAMDVLNKLFSVSQPGAVFSQPVTAGEYTVITACEVSAGLGLGYGGGSGTDEKGEGGGSGGGGGGGGGSFGRPVAAISIGPDGVMVKEIVDPTKIAIAFFTALGAMFMAWRGMRRFGKR